MKFCKNLQRVVEISDPEWAPYWINYKHLKKLIKEIVSSASAAAAAPPADSNNSVDADSQQVEPESRNCNQDSEAESSPNAHAGSSTQNRAQPAPVAAGAAPEVEHQSQGDETSERRQGGGEQSQGASAASRQTPPQQQQHPQRPPNSGVLDQLGKCPGERAFFKLLHTEVKKSTHFFEQTQKEYAIREERVRYGMEIIKSSQHTEVSSADERWTRCAQSIFRLYRELLLLETFAIMTYCGFSKILKKHDKNTGFSTKNAFMANIVNQSNFVTYPRLLQMINRCEQLYEEVSSKLVREDKEKLHEDERLFIHMIHKFQTQVVAGGAQEEEKGQPGKGGPSKQQVGPPSPQVSSHRSPLFQQEAWRVHSLKQLVAENDSAATADRTNDDDSDSDVEDAKPKALPEKVTETRKRPPPESQPSDDTPSPQKVAKREHS